MARCRSCAALLIAALTLVLLAAACSSGEQGEVPRITSARTTRDVVDDEAKLSSSLEVHFDRAVTLAPSRVPLASNFEIDVPGLNGGKRRVLVRTAEVDAADTRLIKLKLDQLIPDGATLRVAERAFRQGATGELEARVDGDLSPLLAVLASHALSLGKPDLLNQAKAAELRDSDRDPAAMRQELKAALERRGANPAIQERALARYDALPTAIAPSAKLRAAAAFLTGTFAEPAIDAIFTSTNCTGRPAAKLLFQPPPEAPQLIARVTFGGGQRVLSINPVAEGEKLEHLAPILAHEAIHCDNEDSIAEEVTATAFDAFLYLQLVAADPSLVAAGTTLARELNIDAIALINSGRRLPESVGILPSAGVTQVLPETTVRYVSFGDLVAAAYPGVDTGQSPVEPLATLYVSNLLAPSGMQPGTAFNLRYLDELLGRAVDPAVLLASIRAFGLQIAG